LFSAASFIRFNPARTIGSKLDHREIETELVQHFVASLFSAVKLASFHLT